MEGRIAEIPHLERINPMDSLFPLLLSLFLFHFLSYWEAPVNYIHAQQHGMFALLELGALEWVATFKAGTALS